MRIAVKDLQPNPFRHLDRYPIRRDKVDALKASIRSTEFWDNLVARKNGSGYEIAYGHHRLVALQELGVKGVDIPVRDLDDATMLKIMANENMEEWGASAEVEQETVRAAVQAFAEGKIKLAEPKVMSANAKKAENVKVRFAPSFVAVSFSRRRENENGKVYTAKTVAEFLNWKDWKVESALSALALNEHGAGIDFAELTPQQAKVVSNEVRYVEGEHEDKKLAFEIGNKLADEFRNIKNAGRPRGKRPAADVSTKTARNWTEGMLLEADVRRSMEKAAAKKAKKADKELQKYDRQVKEFLDASKTWLTAMEKAKQALRKFSPEARKFAMRRLDKTIDAAQVLKEALA
jgi:ParB-like chromosome segregation protein Spo0J